MACRKARVSVVGPDQTAGDRTFGTGQFPGWENIAGMLGHFRFVHDHHRAICRVALAADGAVAELAPRLAEHFVRAEIKHFDYDELDDAIAWAGQAAEEDSRPLRKGPAAPVRAEATEKSRA